MASKVVRAMAKAEIRHAHQAKGIKALKARRSKAQGGGCEAAETLGGHEKHTSPEEAAQSASPLQGLT